MMALTTFPMSSRDWLKVLVYCEKQSMRFNFHELDWRS